MIRIDQDLVLLVKDRHSRAWVRNYYRELRQGRRHWSRSSTRALVIVYFVEQLGSSWSMPVEWAR